MENPVASLGDYNNLLLNEQNASKAIHVEEDREIEIRKLGSLDSQHQQRPKYALN